MNSLILRYITHERSPVCQGLSGIMKGPLYQAADMESFQKGHVYPGACQAGPRPVRDLDEMYIRFGMTWGRDARLVKLCK